ncbi:uncharacterized protein LOC143153843 isoform X2 [Ptiloglossa arizonensis]|uniref:uncharacterized protein LOC143153843 isoform X2 n=1 Tax=Ptiloglossa arizonensis TaxID=3350558 RepID=UPI003FA08B8F
MLLFALMCIFQELVVAINGNWIPSALDKSSLSPDQAVERIVGGEITDIRKYPFIIDVPRLLGTGESASILRGRRGHIRILSNLEFHTDGIDRQNIPAHEL